MGGARNGRASLLVGRSAQLVGIQQALQDLAEGRGSAVVVVGEAGVGKTRLVQEGARQAADRGSRVLHGRTSTVGPAVPFRPLTEVLMALARRGELPALDQLGPYRAVLGRLVPDLWQPVNHPGDLSPLVLAEAVLRLLSVLGEPAGCVLVLDDLHDADPETLAVVDYLVDNLADVPLVMLVALRDEPGEANAAMQALVARGAARVVRLQRLDQAEVAKVAAGYLDVGVQDLPVDLVEGLWKRTAGLPLAVEELLQVVVASGGRHRGSEGWQFTDRVERYLPETMVRSVSNRLDRLGPDGRAVLTTAAVLGVRFPIAVVQDVTGLGDREFLGYLRMAVRYQLLQPEEEADWYGFRHPLIAEAVVHDSLPIRLAELAACAADAVEKRFPGVPGAWCQTVAALRSEAGQPVPAGRAFAEAGRRALTDGAPDTAVVLLERADDLLAIGDEVGRLGLLHVLVPALAEVGRLRDAILKVETLPASSQDGTAELVGLHIQLARALADAGRWSEARELLRKARILQGGGAADDQRIGLDLQEFVISLRTPGADVRALGAAARPVIERAERLPLPEAAVDGWQALALADRELGASAEAACYERALVLAERYGLKSQHARMMVLLANVRWMEVGDSEALARAGAEAERLGLVVLSLTSQANLALDAVLVEQLDDAERLLARCVPTVRRLGMSVQRRHLLVTRATLHAHRGERPAMETALEELALEGHDGAEATLAIGLARAFCALVEGQPDRGRAELAEVAERERTSPTPYQLTGTHGLALLLAVLDGEPLARPGEGAVARQLRWNHHWVALAEAVVHGRAGRTARATAAWRQAEELGSIYPTALHLGRWLVGERAQLDGWADGAALLRSAESYFRAAGCPGVVNAARAALRRVGVTVPQHRTGSERVPPSLRERGVTAREFEVLELLLGYASNKEIGAQLHISYRTVEKHVASLITKTDLADRAALRRRAAQLVEPAGT